MARENRNMEIFEKFEQVCDKLSHLSLSSNSAGSMNSSSQPHLSAQSVDKSSNLVIYGVAENKDMNVWKQTVFNALNTVIGRPPAVDDVFRIDSRFTVGKTRPILVRLHSTWDRRLALTNSFRLKTFPERIYFAADESRESRRQHTLERLKKRAERDGKSVSVADGSLTVDGVCVFTVNDGHHRRESMQLGVSQNHS